MKTLLKIALVMFTIFGIADAGYLTYMRVNGLVPPCNPNFQCEDVLASPWSSIGPFPLSALGLLFYSTFFILAVLNFVDVQSLKLGSYNVRMTTVVAAIGTFGMLFSGYLLLLMGVILQAWCLYCLISAAICFTLGGLSLTQYFLAKKVTPDAM